MYLRFLSVIIALSLGLHLQAQKTEPIRGIWVTNVGSDALISEKNIKRTVENCKKNGLNTVFVVVWNNGRTMYPSAVTEKYIGIRQDSSYHSFDPLKAIIKEAHKKGIKVHAWFEFGFSYAYKDSNSIWINKYPHWAARKKDGSYLQKNGFYWWNGLFPEVQDFMTSLVTEVVKNYAVDGVQGDDRLPAMPSEGGYDVYTSQLFTMEFPGEKLPEDPKEKRFVQWKADKISLFGKNLYAAVKQVRKNCIVSWAPSIYPWSKEEYLQDWPAWLKGGYADYIIPQLYRYDIVGYEKILKELVKQVPPEFHSKIFPGILTTLADGYQSSRKLTEEMIRLNRQYGFKGEVFFYYELLNRLKGNIYDPRN